MGAICWAVKNQPDNHLSPAETIMETLWNVQLTGWVSQGNWARPMEQCIYATSDALSSVCGGWRTLEEMRGDESKRQSGSKWGTVEPKVLRTFISERAVKQISAFSSLAINLSFCKAVCIQNLLFLQLSSYHLYTLSPTSIPFSQILIPLQVSSLTPTTTSSTYKLASITNCGGKRRRKRGVIIVLTFLSSITFNKILSGQQSQTW